MNILKTDILHLLQNFSDTSTHNRVPEDIALIPECAGIRMYDWPLVGVSAAQDEIYKKYKSPEVVGEQYMLPS